MRDVLDLVTFTYRWAYEAVRLDGESHPAVVVVGTWVLGTVFAFAVLGLVALAVYGVCWRVYLLTDAVFGRAARGAGTDRLRSLAIGQARCERAIVAVRSRTGVGPGWRSPRAADGLAAAERVDRVVWDVLARVFTAAAGFPLVLAAVMRALFSVVGVVTVAATWWAVGAPVPDRLRGLRWAEADIEPIAWLGAVAAVVSIGSFAFVRLVSPRRRAAAMWRRDEVVRTLKESERCRSASWEVVWQVDEALDDALGQWRDRMFDLESSLDTAIADAVERLCRESGLSVPERYRWRARYPRGVRAAGSGGTDEVLEMLGTFRERWCDSTSPRAERFHAWARRRVRMWASPWRLGRDAASMARALTIGSRGTSEVLSAPREQSSPEATLESACELWERDKAERLREEAEAAYESLWRGWVAWASLRHGAEVLDRELRPVSRFGRLFDRLLGV
ncbi:hypothetical protein JL108_08665 [Aeromicrobium sp. YIM 150415]|uniref:hypothetical protein n=1 Tax=Aeromicrobium sp. YIM 150415 TaxID=2803912 RepID=UPI001965C509|nr:hypothetical protein [Aeromicrobium sp. YIM 150415]MBM9463522.1 hypothetical protein [Aeromicrobium sp. YIM 150415]